MSHFYIGRIEILLISAIGVFFPIQHSYADKPISFEILKVDLNAQYWICKYTHQSHGSLYIHCEDFKKFAEKDPVLSDEPDSRQSTLIPIWTSPHSDRSAYKLAKLMLCENQGSCSVFMDTNSN